MSEAELVDTIARERITELTSRFAEPQWLAEARMGAWETYLQTPMPTRLDAEWRRTDLSGLDLTRLRAFDLGRAKRVDKQPAAPDWFARANERLGKTAAVLFQTTKNGGYLELPEELSKKGVVFCDLATAVEQHADKVRPHLLRATSEDGKFGLLAKALFNCGAFLYLPRNVVIDEPFVFGLGFSANHDGGLGGAIFPRVVVHAESNSKANLIFMTGPETDADAMTASSKPLSLACGLADMHIGPGAQVCYLESQGYAADVFFVEKVRSYVARDASFNSLSVATGGRQTKADIETYLQDRGAVSCVLGAVCGQGHEHFNYNTVQEHNAPDTRSDINFRVALQDSSSSVYQGIIRVAKEAQKTDAFQSNKNLLLGADSRADSVPKLEILADDVKCSHGATVGPIDRDQIFYLQSRGLPQSQAEELIVKGFFRKVLAQFPMANAIEWVNEVVARKFGGETEGVHQEVQAS